MLGLELNHGLTMGVYCLTSHSWFAFLPVILRWMSTTVHTYLLLAWTSSKSCNALSNKWSVDIFSKNGEYLPPREHGWQGHNNIHVAPLDTNRRNYNQDCQTKKTLVLCDGLGSDQRDEGQSSARCRFRSATAGWQCLDNWNGTFKKIRGKDGPQYEEGPCQLLGCGSG